MKKSNRFQVSDRYELGAFIMPMASILMTISRAKKPNIMSSNVCNILHRDVVQVSSSAQGWYMPNVTQFNSMAIILMRSNHVLFVEKGKFIFQQKKEKKKKKERNPRFKLRKKVSSFWIWKFENYCKQFNFNQKHCSIQFQSFIIYDSDNGQRKLKKILNRTFIISHMELFLSHQ